MMSSRRSGVSLQVAQDGPGYESETYGWTAVIDASVILDADQLHCFLVNRSLDEAHQVRVAVADTAVSHLINGELLTGPGPKAANSWEERDVVGKRPFSDVQVSNGAATVELPPLSMAALTLKLER
jgi:alpha-N-arabinofuranosidase